MVDRASPLIHLRYNLLWSVPFYLVEHGLKPHTTSQLDNTGLIYIYESDYIPVVKFFFYSK